MSADPSGPAGEPANAEVYQALQALGPGDRAEAVLRLIQENPRGRLELPARDGHRAMLNDTDLSRHALAARRAHHPAPPWWDNERQAANLRHAALAGASLRQANLEGAQLEEADLAGADLIGASLRGAVLDGAQLQDALLEDADLRKASLRFAVLKDCALEGARLQGADLWGVQGPGAVLAGAAMEGVVLEEANLEGADLRGADLRGAVLRTANLRHANLEGADLQGAVLTGADLSGAVLREAKLQELVLSHCRLAHVHLADAWLDKTRVQADQLEGAIGEELAGAYEAGRRGYLALERNFESLGDPDAASWAYRRKRRMQKRHARQRGREDLAQGRWAPALGWYLKYGNDQLVEWMCDYGESIPRVLLSFVAVYVLFVVIYALTGTVVRVDQGPAGPVKTPTYNLIDLALFSFTAITAPGNPPDWLLPGSWVGYLLAGAQALLSVFLVGLLGFVAGNRIRR